MSGPILTVYADPPLRFWPAGTVAPGVGWAVGLGIGPLRRPADGAESASVIVHLDNADGALSALLAVPPLGASAILSGPDGAEGFRGRLAGVRLEETADLELEA